ncbi:TnpV protein [Chakrabartyella piscis]|uniref:TnpV protein n=1 Tax=Chakrabartyella piscis TaxID=2918914 RepID=UPI002958396D|nr:TnpV protein [Chakrabartyella piscis]
MLYIEYEEVDGLLYPRLDMGLHGIDTLGKFGKAKMEYIYNHKIEMYRELLLSGKLLQYLTGIDEKGYKQSEELQQKYLFKYDLSLLEFNEVVQLRTQARNWADEIVMTEMTDDRS